MILWRQYGGHADNMLDTWKSYTTIMWQYYDDLIITWWEYHDIIMILYSLREDRQPKMGDVGSREGGPEWFAEGAYLPFLLHPGRLPKWRPKGSKHVRGGFPWWRLSMNLQSWWIRRDQSRSKAQTNSWIMYAIIVQFGRLFFKNPLKSLSKIMKIVSEGPLGFCGPSTALFWCLSPSISLLWLRIGVFGGLRWCLSLPIW